MTFRDIFKSDFLENMAGASMLDMAAALTLSFLLGLFIFFIYRKSYSGVMYSASFGISLVAMAMITCLLITTVVSNVVLSLGMVGALSIVRFRTAVKDPLDIVFLFWSIAAGIVLAAGMLHFAVFGSAFIGVVLIVFGRNRIVDSPYILMIHLADGESEERTRAFIQGRVRKLSLKSKTVEAGQIELNYEIRLKEGESGFVNELEAMEGVRHVVLVSYNGDYMG
ncbi:MAG: DUF4956 domain-containing protein [Anaerovoracaceae bacterium]